MPESKLKVGRCVEITAGPYAGEKGRVREVLSDDQYGVKLLTGPDAHQQGTFIAKGSGLTPIPDLPSRAEKLEPIPISAAEKIAKAYGYDQVIIYARRCHTSPEPHGEHLTTYGRNKEHCSVAARIGDTLKRLMGWQTQKDQWVEKQAMADYAAMRDEGQPQWGELTDETKERFREPLRREWDED